MFLFYLPLLSKSIIVKKNSTINTIERAINVAGNNDTIIVEKGTYYEHELHISKHITLISKEATIDAEYKGGIFVLEADSITIKGFILNNIKSSHIKDKSAIYVINANYFTIEDNTINNPFFAIQIHRSKYGIINNNNIYGDAKVGKNSGNGVHIWHSDHLQISNNHINQMRDGIYLEFADDCKIEHNISTNNIRYGLHFMFSNNNLYANNEFNNNGAGVAVMFSKFIHIENNLFKLNWGSASYGLLLKEIYDSEITNNTFVQNTIGIYSEGTARINYQNNSLKNNGWGVKIAGGCYENKFTNNNFINNAFDISYNGRMNDNTFNRNYWSAYTGYDLDKDGVGDIPYRPVKLFSYIVNRTPETIVLLRSLFIDLINFSEKVSPIFTPDQLKDNQPLIKLIN